MVESLPYPPLGGGDLATPKDIFSGGMSYLSGHSLVSFQWYA